MCPDPSYFDHIIQRSSGSRCISLSFYKQKKALSSLNSMAFQKVRLLTGALAITTSDNADYEDALLVDRKNI